MRDKAAIKGRRPLVQTDLGDFKWTCTRCDVMHISTLDPNNDLDSSTDEEDVETAGAEVVEIAGEDEQLYCSK
ncbi:hypothetical protein JTB14_013304 [Gonioctena quinquepunctata]|nr:hypothetical protein JTB14_013304 [Gonioctena quinquepunctata]